MSLRQDRRTFLTQVMGAAGAGLVVPLLGACTQSAPQPAAAPTTAPVAGSSVTRVSYAYASPNGLHFVATVGGEKPDLAHKFGIEFDLLTTTNAPNAVNALVGGSVNVAAVTPDSAWPAQDKAPDAKQISAIADGTPYVLLAQPEVKKASELKGKTLGVSALVGGADSSEKRRWNGIPADAGEYQAKTLDDYLIGLQLPDRATDVTIRLMRTTPRPIASGRSPFEVSSAMVVVMVRVKPSILPPTIITVPTSAAARPNPASRVVTRLNRASHTMVAMRASGPTIRNR